MANEALRHQEYKYLIEPGNESCYEYMRGCYARIKADVGEYPAFKIYDCDTSMADMIDEAERLAAYLIHAGYKADDVVSVFLPTCAHGLIAFYALSKVGIIADYIHPLTPPNVLAKMLKHTKSKAVFMLDMSVDSYAPQLEDYEIIACRFSDHTFGSIKDYIINNVEKDVIIPECENIKLYSEIVHNNFPRVESIVRTGKETAVYMHGSGTTGKSKVVCLSAYALNHCAYKQYFVDHYHEYGKSYSLAVLPFFHAFGLGTALHLCVCNCYPPILVPKFDPVKVNDYIAKYNVQYIDGVPNMFFKMYEAENFDNPGLANLTMVYSGGDIVSEAFVQKFKEKLQKHGNPGTLNRGWGLTEMCAVCATNAYDAYREGSVGRPIKGLKAKAIDDAGKTLPVGEQGEICLSGETMMNGYLPDEDVDFSGISHDDDGLDWVHTGDMGYIDEDGYIFFTGRKKRIIIISGVNVYPYNIEQEVAHLPQVLEACAVQGYLENGKPCVKLCLVFRDSVKDIEAEKVKIFEFCQNNLNGYSVPRKIEVMDKLPRTKMDKLDFLAMSDPVPEN